ncbi:hypothetical protein Sango_3113100 [Sesamum angolense]|uniref:CCHC-type domain-containing protein n=1 Tax=Sesamum angolense TaxID=2727404 RepID=A0AAE1T8G3_9LAMI|nr:hypothetical protein Sango_3113100 [Sesamum angolense]
MLPNSPNSLCSLTHTTHVDNLDGNTEEDEAEHGDSEFLEGGTPCNVSGDFDEFYDLATRVLNGDSDSMVSLNSLKVQWEQKFKTRRNPALKSVTGRPSTPFRPRISFLPRRIIRTGDLETSVVKEGQDTSLNRKDPDNSSNLASNSPPIVQEEQPEHPVIYVGNVKLQASSVDNIAGAFLQSSRKTLHFVPPTRQNDEIVIRPTKEVVDNGSKKWQSTAVGYFLGRRPFAMEEVIEGGPWLFQGQSIVLQFWEQSMSLRREKHTQIPVWIRLKHLPMEYWTDEGLSIVASGIGTPLYTDGITKECSRLDYAREDPKRVDVEYEWLPQRCTNCRSLGHVAATCPANTKRNIAPPITILVKKPSVKLDPMQPAQNTDPVQSTHNTKSAGPASVSNNRRDSVLGKGKDIVLYNSYGAVATDAITETENQLTGPNNRSPTVGDS